MKHVAGRATVVFWKLDTCVSAKMDSMGKIVKIKMFVFLIHVKTEEFVRKQTIATRALVHQDFKEKTAQLPNIALIRHVAITGSVLNYLEIIIVTAVVDFLDEIARFKTFASSRTAVAMEHVTMYQGALSANAIPV